jgi:hypothetical protein
MARQQRPCGSEWLRPRRLAGDNESMTVSAALLLLLLSSAPPPSLDPYLGEYSLVAAESDDMQKVVEEAAAGLNIFVRSIARGRLRKTQIAFPLIRISRSGDGFRIAHNGGTDVSHRTVEDPVHAKSPDGARIVVRLIPGPPLTQTYESGDGMRMNRYVLSAEMSKLTMEVRVTSPRLPKPIEYKLVYRRNSVRSYRLEPAGSRRD